MEQDFTTGSGTEASLGCPFASKGMELPSDHPNITTPSAVKDGQSTALADPIAAEFHPNHTSSPQPSVNGSLTKCPIRFLDQHSPEEVAQYFENHKHEIPRSHEVCVKRYQKNEESIRQLDAKYGNLVSMIQGLGNKHKPMLSADEEMIFDAQDGKTNERVERWAENISEVEEQPSEDLGVKDRDGRFERSLKEIRVGESPSRPWGISVPLNDLPKVDFASIQDHRDGNGVRPGSRGANSEEPRKRSFDPTFPSAEPQASAKVNGEQEAGTSKGFNALFLDGQRVEEYPKMVFTGPVFIGYPIDQALMLIKELRKQ